MLRAYALQALQGTLLSARASVNIFRVSRDYTAGESDRKRENQQMLRLIFAALGFLIFVVCFLPVLGILRIVRHYNPQAALNASSVIIRGFLSVILFISGTRIEVEGKENIPNEAVLFVGNHRSDFDILVSYTNINKNVGFVAKKSMKDIPVIAWWMDMIGCLFLDRENAREGLKTILAAIEQVKHGTSVCIFPEGTRNKSEDADVPAEFKEGALKIAEKAKCLIVPMVIKDTELIFEKQKPLIKAQTVRLKFLKPFYAKDIPEEYRKTPAAYVRGLIAEELQAMKSKKNVLSN